MTARDRYASPAAFRRALIDRLTDATHRSRWSLQQLQRQVAYDRLLERLYLVDDGWVVKGAAALLARDLGARARLDVDVYRAVELEVGEADVRRADDAVGDWFRFEIGPRTTIGNDSVRLPVDVVIGATTWTAFHVDLSGTTIRMTGQPENVPPVAKGSFPTLVSAATGRIRSSTTSSTGWQRPTSGTARWRTLPLATATSSTWWRSCGVRPSKRSPRRRRSDPNSSGVASPCPRPSTCRTARCGSAGTQPRRGGRKTAQTLDEALAIVRPFLDPLLEGRATGAWDHAAQRWGAPRRHELGIVGVTGERTERPASTRTPQPRRRVVAQCRRFWQTPCSDDPRGPLTRELSAGDYPRHEEPQRMCVLKGE